MSKYSLLLKPIQLSNLTLKNRIMFPPLTTGYEERDGSIGQRSLAFYERLAQGCTVSIIEMMDKIANSKSSTILPTIMGSFKAHNVQQYVNTKVSAIEAGAVKAIQGEEEITIPCDTVVMAVGSKKNRFDTEGVTVPVIYTGDCSGERTAGIAEAIRSGYSAANSI